MKVPPNPAGDTLILDYLSRVTEIGLRVLPKGDRIAFISATRARIERECGREGLADSSRVLEVLAALGDPEELVRQERARIDARWARRHARRYPHAGQVTTAHQQPTASLWKPTHWKPAHWKPAHWKPNHRKPDAGAAPLPVQPDSPPGGWAGTPPAPSGLPPVPGEGGQGDRAMYPDDDTGLPLPWRSDLPEEGPAWPALQALTGRAAALARAGAPLARAHPLEAAAVALLGIGGVILPFPFWLIGGLVAVVSRFFGTRDKWIALAGPLTVVVLGTVVTAAVIRSTGNPVVTYIRALRLDTGSLIRVGCLICGGYLAWRLPRGPHVRVPPWRR